MCSLIHGVKGRRGQCCSLTAAYVLKPNKMSPRDRSSTEQLGRQLGGGRGLVASSTTHGQRILGDAVSGTLAHDEVQLGWQRFGGFCELQSKQWKIFSSVLPHAQVTRFSPISSWMREGMKEWLPSPALQLWPAPRDRNALGHQCSPKD